MQKPTIFVTRRWPEETVEEMKKFFEVTINHDDRPLTQNEIADGFESHDALAPTVSDNICLLYTSPSPRDQRGSRMPSSA